MESENRLEKLAKIKPVMKRAMAEEDVTTFGLLAYEVLGMCEQERLYKEGVNAAGHLHYHAVDRYVKTRGMALEQADECAEAIFGFRSIAARLDSL